MSGGGAGPLGLFTDFYELTMAAAFVAEGRSGDDVTFDLFVRSLPPERQFLVACGLDTALDALEAFTYSPDAVDYLASLAMLPPDFCEQLRTFRFSGEVRAVAEGELVFAGEPIVSVTAPIVEAQLVETLLVNVIGLETMLASKAARVTLACQGRAFVDFSARRDHGRDAALAAARASYVAGAAATSLVQAGQRFGLDLSGTMAHSYVMAHGDEGHAFTSFLERFRERSVLLVDTYDTVEGTRRAVEAMDATGIVANGIRIDSGDLGALAAAARQILDDGGYPTVQILLSGDLDEHRIAALLAGGAPVDAFGVGTRMGTSADAPYLGVVYKLVCQAGEPRMKLSPGKQTLPGRKQVWRSPGEDLIAIEHEPGPAGARPLLSTVMAAGRRTAPPEPLAAARARCLAALDTWTGQPPEITASAALHALRDEAERVLTAED